MTLEQQLAQDPQAFLQAQTQRYHEAPDRAAELFAELLPLFESLPEPPPPGMPAIRFALLLCQLAIEERATEWALPVLERALRWSEREGEAPLRPRLFGAAARVYIGLQQLGAATEWLGRAGAALAAMPEGSLDRVAPAVHAHNLGAIALRQGDTERALAQNQRALSLFRESGYGGPWIQAYARSAIMLRELGRHEEREAMLLEGRQEALRQRRFGEAGNLCAGLVDVALERGDLALAEQRLQEGQTCLQQGSVPTAAIGWAALSGARARWLAASERFGEACVLLEAGLEQAGLRGGQRELLRNLDELWRWQAKAGRADLALKHGRQAHALRLALARDAADRDALRLRQQMELEQAEREMRAHEQRAAQAQTQQQQLQQALDRLQNLQEELAERSRQASLGPLLAGVAHELNTPLGTALTALSSAAEGAQELLATLGSGAASRQGLLARLQALQEVQALAARSLRRALTLIESYRPQHPDCDARAALVDLVQRAWQRALPPEHPLQLQLRDDVGVPVWPEGAMEEVLVQLFQNVERHAYPAGEAGAVEVHGRRGGNAALHLAVRDHGRGIDPDLLPRVFEPYVSTQFGRGRSGLGLFIAEATVRQRLGGRLHARSHPGQGSCFEIECPSPEG